MYCSTVQAVGSKRPTSDRSQPAGGKKVCTKAGETPRQKHLDKISSQLELDKDDKKASKCLVDNTLNILLGNEVISGNVKQFTHAGSYPVNLKIGKADEFDVIFPLNIDCKKVRQNGKVTYSYGDENLSNNHFDRNQCLCYDPDGKSIPNGYAVVDVKMDVLHERSEIPIDPFSLGYMMSINGSFWLNSSEASSGCIELIPWEVKRNLYSKLVYNSNFKYRGLKTVVSPISHGPALTIIIPPREIAGITHPISVDITPSLQCNIPLRKFGWPRKETLEAFGHVNINEVIEVGTHLVPKKDLFWAISFSKAEKKLLKNIDCDQGCRKYVTKLLKKFVQTCRSQSQNGLTGISSHIIKTQVLWSCEKHCNDRTYWHWDNRDSCLITTMKELEGALRNRRLSDYFNPKLNILKGKEDFVLDQLAGLISRERKFLMKF